MDRILIILGNQLFPIKYIKEFKPTSIYMREDMGLCSYEKHHKHKIVLFLSAMRSYRDELEKNNLNVHYEELNPSNSESYIVYLTNFLNKNKVKDINFFEVEDKWFEKKIMKMNNKYNVNIIKSPMFLTTRDEFSLLSPPGVKLPMHKMASFYIAQRKKMNILIKDGKPIGDKWSHDKDNRKKLPKDIEVPEIQSFKDTNHTKEVKKIVDDVFPKNYGTTDTFNCPTTRNTGLKLVDSFIKDKLDKFGDYEDSVDDRSPYWFHSVLSPLLNIGLITPNDILSRILKADTIQINSHEGYIRQLIGWREFMRGIYHEHGLKMSRSNFFDNKRTMTDSWYDGSTGLLPLDYSIKSTLKYSYAHHIERLMIQANVMNLCEIHPNNVYKWFMEMYIDSSDWVMTPNVYSMGLFADGGIMATKPYLCGSNYILKMMNFKKGDWCKIMDGLYWRFINKHIKFFKSNPRLSMMAVMLEKMDISKKKEIFNLANTFIKENTKE